MEHLHRYGHPCLEQWAVGRGVELEMERPKVWKSAQGASFGPQLANPAGPRWLIRFMGACMAKPSA